VSVDPLSKFEFAPRVPELTHQRHSKLSLFLLLEFYFDWRVIWVVVVNEIFDFGLVRHHKLDGAPDWDTPACPCNALDDII
jgi:hypothetical protein